MKFVGFRVLVIDRRGFEIEAVLDDFDGRGAVRAPLGGVRDLVLGMPIGGDEPRGCRRGMNHFYPGRDL